jgi:Sperm-tail PG-rich repeat
MEYNNHGAPSYSIGGRTQSKNKNLGDPGPGAYNPDMNPAKEAAPSYKIGTSGSQKSFNKKHSVDNQPGPG